MSKDTVSRVEMSHYRVPLSQALRDSTQSIERFEFIVIEATLDGVQGSGWCYTTGLGGTAVMTILEDLVADLILGTEGAPISSWQRMKHGLTRGGWGQYSALALAAMDIALWDALAQRSNLPLHSLLGGTARECPTYGSGVDLADSPEELHRRVSRTIRDGYAAVKIKVGHDRRVDRMRMAAARECLGPDRDLFVDANQGLDIYEFQRRLPDFTEFGVSFIEEPFPPADLPAYRRAIEISPIPFAAGETLNAPIDFAAPIADGLWQILQPDVCRIGGITPWLRVARMAEACNLAMTSHFVIELAAHMASASPAVRYVEVTDHNLLHLGIATGGIQLGQGVASPTETPGHGVNLEFHEAHLIRNVSLAI